MLLGLPLSSASRDPLAFPPLSVLDLFAFLGALFPALLADVPPSALIQCLLSTLLYTAALPPALILPRLGLLKPAYPWPAHEQPSLLQDICIRLVRHAFRNFPHTVGRTFFSERVSAPLMRSRFGERLERYCSRVDVDGTHGWWIATDGAQELAQRKGEAPDVVILYIHGGGLTMGGPAFYLHTLALLAGALHARGFARPAIFAPEYGLAPETRHPEQRAAVRRAWTHVLERAGDAPVGVGGDSAGGLHALALVLGLGEGTRHPDFATLISPWTSLRPLALSRVQGDFVDPAALNHFARLGSGAQPRARTPSPLLSLLCPPAGELDPSPVLARHSELCAADPFLCPGDASPARWAAALAGVRGVLVTYGTSETLAPQARDFVGMLRGIEARHKESGMVIEDAPLSSCHAPPVVWAFLGRDADERRRGVDALADFIRRVLA